MATRLVSSRVACVRVSSGPHRATLVQTQPTYDAAATSQPQSAASCHGARNAATTLTATPDAVTTRSRSAACGILMLAPVSHAGAFGRHVAWSPGNTSVSDLCHTGLSPAVSTLNPYSYTIVPPKVAPIDTSAATTSERTRIAMFGWVRVL